MLTVLGALGLGTIATIVLALKAGASLSVIAAGLSVADWFSLGQLAISGVGFEAKIAKALIAYQHAHPHVHACVQCVQERINDPFNPKWFNARIAKGY